MTTYVLELTEQEMRVVRAALEAHRGEFGHDEAEVARAIEAVIARVRSTVHPTDDPAAVSRAR